jgi:hypothetical protein
MPLRSSIATKIFGLAVLLLCLTVALACFLLWHVTQLNRQLSMIATLEMPLSTALANVNDYGLRRRLAFERLYGAYGSGNPGPDIISEATQNYALYTERSTAEIAKAKQLLEAKFETAGSLEKHSEIRTLLSQIESTYLIIMARQQEVLDLIKSGQRDRAEAVRTVLADIQRHVQDIRQQIQAEKAFQACLDVIPHDGPAQVFLSRTCRLREQPPGDSWNGVWHLESK